MKNITIISVNFYPEDSSTGLYTTEMADYLAANGYNVSVITGVPYYPQWKINHDYINKNRFLNEKKGDINIYRYKLYVPKTPSFLKRILHLLDFTLGSVRNIFKIKNCDLVISVVPFTSNVFLGYLLAKKKNAKLWAHIQDFEFDAAIESGMVKNKSGLKSKVFGFLFWLEKKLLKKAAVTSTISFGMMEKIRSKTGKSPYYFPNWVSPVKINSETATTHSLLTSPKYKILYSGNIGAKQDWVFFMKTVEAFKDDSTIEFIIVGDGAMKSWLVNETKTYKNIQHHDPVALCELSNLLCSADLHVLFQKSNVIDTVMPSKLLGMMSSGTPSIVTGNLKSEVAKVFEESGGGYFHDASDFVGVTGNILTLKNDQTLSTKKGLLARDYVIGKFSEDTVLAAFGSKIKEVLNE